MSGHLHHHHHLHQMFLQENHDNGKVILIYLNDSDPFFPNLCSLSYFSTQCLSSTEAIRLPCFLCTSTLHPIFHYQLSHDCSPVPLPSTCFPHGQSQSRPLKMDNTPDPHHCSQSSPLKRFCQLTLKPHQLTLSDRSPPYEETWQH